MRGDILKAEATLTEFSTAFSAEKAKRKMPKIKRATPIVKSKASHKPTRSKGTPKANIKKIIQFFKDFTVSYKGNFIILKISLSFSAIPNEEVHLFSV
jgi:hypothetical protein